MLNPFCCVCETEMCLADEDCLVDTEDSLVCGKCMRMMGLEGEIGFPCHLCDLPMIGDPFLVDDDCHEYCRQCAEVALRSGLACRYLN